MTEERHRPALRCYDDRAPKRRGRRASGVIDDDGAAPEKDLYNPAKLSEEALHEAALRYLDRQDASVEQLRRVLERRLLRYGDESLREEVEQRIEELLLRFQESRLLDDQRFAAGLAESQRRQGGSIPLIRQKLLSRGLPEALVEATLDSFSEDSELSDFASASEYARKRRLKTKYDLSDPKQRQKALASLARQGFSFDVARRVLEL